MQRGICEVYIIGNKAELPEYSFEIYKVQKSLHPKGSMLIYNEERNKAVEIQLTKDVQELLAGRSKAYFYGCINDGDLYLASKPKIKERNWPDW